MTLDELNLILAAVRDGMRAATRPTLPLTDAGNFVLSSGRTVASDSYRATDVIVDVEGGEGTATITGVAAPPRFSKRSDDRVVVYAGNRSPAWIVTHIAGAPDIAVTIGDRTCRFVGDDVARQGRVIAPMLVVPERYEVSFKVPPGAWRLVVSGLVHEDAWLMF